MHLHDQTQKKNSRHVSNILKVNNKDTRMSVASIVNFQYFALYSTDIIAEFKQTQMLVGSENI